MNRQRFPELREERSALGRGRRVGVSGIQEVSRPGCADGRGECRGWAGRGWLGQAERAWQPVVLCAGWLLVAATGAVASDGVKSTGQDLTDIPIEKLMDIEVTSVAKKAEKLSESPAAVTVITADDIRRFGATSIPEALRLVPGLDVARLDANEWAISARGFNDVFANKLLVMIDGRSVYTPLFSGVFWDVQDTMLEDIDRIEVVRGPGATLWGANAVNGVINIITKSAKDTQGALATGGGGTEELGFGGVRYGGKLADNAWFRVYGKYFDMADFPLYNGAQAYDGWQKGQGGFRADWDVSDRNAITFQGDGYAGLVHQVFGATVPANPPTFYESLADQFSMSGGNLQGRWVHTYSEDSDLQVQAYWDHTERHTEIFQDNLNTYDVELQHRFPVGTFNDVVWGLGYRYMVDHVGNSPTVALAPDRLTDQLFSAFVQDEITLVPDRLHLTLGSKLEHNDFTGFEVEPGARLSWTPQDRHMIWGSISRAVRTPSFAEEDVTLNHANPPGSPLPPTTLYGAPDFLSEEVIAYEIGYRAQPLERVSFDVSTFYNVYSHLRSQEFGAPPGQAPAFLPFHLGNGLGGDTYGVELGPTWRVADWWQLRPSYTWLHMHLFKEPGSTDPGSIAQEGWSPQQQFSLFSSMDLPYNLSFDWDVRYVDSLPALGVPSYVVMDLRLGWRPSRNLEFAVVAQNLGESQHAEFVPTFINTQLTQVPRSVYAQMTWRF
ncbi:MAG: TonB-dependent receptor [Verrucomicrobia bacterium]|nr:TonB-dependent receptor [Verrucomicrobiota bacterium]